MPAPPKLVRPRADGPVERTIAEDSTTVFDLRPADIGGFRFTARACRPIGRVTFDGWLAAIQFALGAHHSAPYWVGDLLNFAEDRADWQQRREQILTLTGYAEKTVRNLAYVARHVEEPERQLAPSITHAAQVAKLPRVEQTELLTEARRDELTVSEFQRVVRQRARRKVLEGQATLAGMYRVFLADPPWTYHHSQPSGSQMSDHYSGMSVEQLCALPVEAHALEHAVLFMWVTAPMLYYSSDGLAPDPYRVIRAWGFEPKTGIVWDKVLHNFGNYVSVRHEHLLIATRGSCLPDRPTLPDSVQTVRREGEHSEKPEDFRRLIEQLYDGPYLELFARRQVEGWACFGNDAALWHQEATA